MTKFKQDIISLGKTDLEMQLQDLIDTCKGPFEVDVVTAKEVQEYFDRTQQQRSPTIKALCTTLAEMGAENHKFAIGPKDKRKKFNVWIIRNNEDWLKKPGPEFFMACQEQRTGKLHLSKW